MSLIIIHFLFFFLITLSNGYLISSLLNLEFEKKLFHLGILGIVGTGFFSNFISFFVPLNDIIIFINAFILIAYFIYKKENIFLNLKLEKINLAFLSLIFLGLFQVYGSGFSDDLHHYHAAFITNTDNLKNIFGINFLHNHFGHSSIWLTLHSYMNFNNYLLQDIHILNIIIFCLILCYLFNEAVNGTHKLKVLGVFLIFFFLAKYTRLKEFGIDRPAIMLCCFLLFEYFKISELKSFNNKNLFFLSSISLFLISIKIIFFFSLLMPISIFYNLKKKLLFFKSKYFFILTTLILLFFSKNIISSGCVIYPVEKLCLSEVSWNSKNIAKKIYINTSASTKSYDKYKGTLTKTEYIKKFNWLNTWKKRNINEIKDFILTILVIFLITLSILEGKKIKKNKNFFLFLLLLSNSIVFYLSPVLRYHHFLFLIFFIYTINFISFKKINLKKFYIFFSLLIIFNFSKNIFRQIDNNLSNDPINHIKEIGWYKSPKEKRLNKLKYYNGWIGNYPIGNEDLSKKYYYKKKFGYDFIIIKEK